MCRCVVLGLPLLVFLLTTGGSVGAVSRPRHELASARQGAGMTHTTSAVRQVGHVMWVDAVRRLEKGLR